MSGIHIGIIAEDSSDVDVVKCLLQQLSGRKFSTSHFVGKGCGPLRKKTPGWCRVFEQKGCVAIVLVHDLDRNDPTPLRKALESALSTAKVQDKVVVIPTEELEAWLLADADAIRAALNLVKKPKTVHHPEMIRSPKEHLAAIVRSCSKNKQKYYVNTVHNRLIAEYIDTRKIADRCPTFGILKQFARKALS